MICDALLAVGMLGLRIVSCHDELLPFFRIHSSEIWADLLVPSLEAEENPYSNKYLHVAIEKFL
jgi:hypothetical protein